MDESAIRSLVEALVRAWNVRDLDLFLSFLDESVVWSDPAMLYGPASGKKAVREFSESILRAFPDFSYRIREPICVATSGERCIVPWEISATHTGYLDPPGLAPTHQVITMQGVDVLELANSKITRIDTLFNVLPAAEQALRLKPFPKRGVTRNVLISLQRCRAYWLRRTTKAKK
jgi:hypothetical protein